MQIKRGGLLYNRIKFSLFIVLSYMVGKAIPIPFVVHTEAQKDLPGMVQFLTVMLGSGAEDASLFALGLQPWVASSICVQIFTTLFLRNRKDSSKERTLRMTLILMVLIAIPQAFIRANHYQYAGMFSTSVLKSLTVLSLVAGSILVIHLGGLNLRYGIGGPSLLIAHNVVHQLLNTMVMTVQDAFSLVDPSAISMALFAATFEILLIMVVSFIFESAEIHIPLHRSIIETDMKDKDYLAVRLSPVGAMPAMYAMSLLSIPFYLLSFLRLTGPAAVWQQVLLLDSPLTLAGFLVFLFALTLVLAWTEVNPSDISEDLMKQNDYILDVAPGKATKRRIRYAVFFTASLSGFVMVMIIGIPMMVRLARHDTSPLYMLPTTIMILVGIAIQILREIRVLHEVEDYHSFL